MALPAMRYTEQVDSWPNAGRHILAHYDDDTIIVYQAYRPQTGRFTIEHGFFGGGFSLSRMSWIKPNFLWMMYRSGWATKEAQEVVLGLRLRREFFDGLLAQAVQSTYYEGHYATQDLWQQALATSSVRLQWDPDHDPAGAKLERRAVQLGLRGDVLAAFAKRELVEVIDMTPFVAQQRARLQSGGLASLETPHERVYVPAEAAVANRLGLDSSMKIEAPGQ